MSMHVLLILSNDADDVVMRMPACVFVCQQIRRSATVLDHKYSLFIFPRTCIPEVSVSVRRRFPRLRVELARLVGIGRSSWLRMEVLPDHRAAVPTE